MLMPAALGALRANSVQEITVHVSRTTMAKKASTSGVLDADACLSGCTGLTQTHTRDGRCDGMLRDGEDEGSGIAAERERRSAMRWWTRESSSRFTPAKSVLLPADDCLCVCVTLKLTLDVEREESSGKSNSIQSSFLSLSCRVCRVCVCVR